MPAEVSPIPQTDRTRHPSTEPGVFLRSTSACTATPGDEFRTDDVIAILIPDQRLQRAFPFVVEDRQDIDNLLPLRRGAELNALFDHVAGELVFGQVGEVPGDQRDDLGPVLLPAVFDDVLGHVIAVLIDDQRRRACVQFVQDGRPRGFFAVLQHALNDPTAVRVHGQAVHLTRERVDDELDVHRRHPLDGLLDHMVPVLIFDAFEHMLFEFFDQLRLLVRQNMLQRLRGLAGMAGRMWFSIPTFCTTRHPYICRESVKMWFFIWFASIFFCAWFPCSKNF